MALKECDPVQALRAFVARYPTQKAAAAEIGISQPFLFDLLNGNRSVPDKVLQAIGLRRTVVFK